MLYPLENGILSPLYAATTEEGASLNGKVRFIAAPGDLSRVL